MQGEQKHNTKIFYKCISDFWHLCKMSDIVDCITGYRTEFFPGIGFLITGIIFAGIIFDYLTNIHRLTI